MNQYDLTGTNPQYKAVDQRFYIFKENQVIEFKEPVFANSIIIRKLGDPITTLQQGVDWIIRDVDSDHASISFAKLIDPSFNLNLVKSVVIISNFTEGYQISTEYQRFFTNYLQQMYYTEDGIECTPQLLKEIVDTLYYLRNIKDPTKDLIADHSLAIRALDEDYTGTATTHIITDEIHTLNVPNGKMIVRPSTGAFYKHDVVVKLVSTGATLVNGTDYLIVGCNLARTKVSHHPSGVYDYIYMLAPIVGEVEISYRAFGGEVTVLDINNLYSMLTSLFDYFKNKEFLVEETLGYTSIIIDILDRLFVLEEFMRHNKRSCTHGLSSMFYLRPLDDQIHWYPIMTLYKRDEDGDTIYTKDQAVIRMKFANYGTIADVSIAVNLDPAQPSMSVKHIGGFICDPNHPPTSLKSLERRLVPHFRVVWNNPSSTELPITGCVLQMGIALKHFTQDDVLITDISSPSSKWCLKLDPGAIAPIEDTQVLLPDDSSSWMSNTVNSHTLVKATLDDNGYLTWFGNLSLNNAYVADVEWEEAGQNGTVEGGSNIYYRWMELFNAPIDTKRFIYLQPCISDDLPLDTVKTIRVHLYDRFNGSSVVLESATSRYNDMLYASGVFYTPDLCTLSTILFIKDGQWALGIVPTLGRSSKVHNRFDIRQIVLK